MFLQLTNRFPRLLTVAAEVTVFVVDSLHVSGDLFDHTVLAHTRHVVGFLKLVRTVHAAQKNHLVLHAHTEDTNHEKCQPERTRSIFCVHFLESVDKTLPVRTKSISGPHPKCRDFHLKPTGTLLWYYWSLNVKLSTHNLFVSINYLHLDELRFKSDDAGALEAVHFLGHFCLLLHWRCTNGLNLGRSHGQLCKNIHLLLRLLKFFLKRRKRNNRSLKYQLSFFKNLS